MWQDKLKEIIYILEHSNVNEIDVTFLGRRFRVVKSTPVTAVASQNPTEANVSMTPVSPSVKETTDDTAGETTSVGKEVLSPMPGTFYRAAGPEDKAFVQAGDVVKKGDPLCIIEAMKIMNEIESEESGIIRNILVENAQPVEYNQPLFVIDPNG
ncbi:MAG: acetyl-CoA carboxylase biotin carboxyl carrier protein [Fidelibacterota bacterium]